MFNTSNIKYQINKAERTVIAYIDDTKYDAIDLLMKRFRKVNLPLEDLKTFRVRKDPDNPHSVFLDEDHTTTCRSYLLPDEFTGVAYHSPDDPNPFDVAKGMEIAKYRLYKAYNQALLSAIENLMVAISDVQLDLDYLVDETVERITHDNNQLKSYKGDTKSNGAVGL